jgi:hypothetical protein
MQGGAVARSMHLIKVPACSNRAYIDRSDLYYHHYYFDTRETEQIV